jgi:hypothetical protein
MLEIGGLLPQKGAVKEIAQCWRKAPYTQQPEVLIELSDAEERPKPGFDEIKHI